MQLKHWLTLFVICISGCSSVYRGPSITACVVDMKNQGYQCSGPDSDYFVSFANGDDLYCVSPLDLEDFLKDCRVLKDINYPKDNNAPRIDNDLCLNRLDLKRVLQRCVKD